jgi:hypothetical protein
MQHDLVMTSGNHDQVLLLYIGIRLTGSHDQVLLVYMQRLQRRQSLPAGWVYLCASLDCCPATQYHSTEPAAIAAVHPVMLQLSQLLLLAILPTAPPHCGMHGTSHSIHYVQHSWHTFSPVVHECAVHGMHDTSHSMYNVQHVWRNLRR